MPFSAKQLINIKTFWSWLNSLFFLFWRGLIPSFQSIEITTESFRKLIHNFFYKCFRSNLPSLLENEDTKLNISITENFGIKCCAHLKTKGCFNLIHKSQFFSGRNFELFTRYLLFSFFATFFIHQQWIAIGSSKCQGNKWRLQLSY